MRVIIYIDDCDMIENKIIWKWNESNSYSIEIEIERKKYAFIWNISKAAHTQFM